MWGRKSQHLFSVLCAGSRRFWLLLSLCNGVRWQGRDEMHFVGCSLLPPLSSSRPGAGSLAWITLAGVGHGVLSFALASEVLEWVLSPSEAARPDTPFPGMWQTAERDVMTTPSSVLSYLVPPLLLGPAPPLGWESGRGPAPYPANCSPTAPLKSLELPGRGRQLESRASRRPPS